MWFLFVEIFFLISISFALGAGLTALVLRLVLRAAETEAEDAGEVTS
jgi:hypothetical protein